MKRKSQACVLFDLDGTLISTGGAGNRALEKAFFALYKRSRAMKNVNPAGKTDPAIIREIFSKRFRRDCEEPEMRRVQEQYLGFLAAECETSPGYRVMKGIPELLDQLREREILTGLATGNLERGARIKLTRASLNAALPFGGFGSDSHDRAELLKIAHKKAERYSGGTIAPENIFIVGDTQRDIWAAQKAQFKIIAVATGHASSQILRRFKPDFFLPNFENGHDFLKIVSS